MSLPLSTTLAGGRLATSYQYIVDNSCGRTRGRKTATCAHTMTQSIVRGLPTPFFRRNRIQFTGYLLSMDMVTVNHTKGLFTHRQLSAKYERRCSKPDPRAVLTACEKKILGRIRVPSQTLLSVQSNTCHQISIILINPANVC